MRTILFVDPAPIAGGAQQSLVTLVSALDAEEFRPILAGSPILQEMLPKVPWVRVRFPLLSRTPAGVLTYLFGSLWASWTLFSLIRREGVVLVHANGRAP